MKTQSLKQKLFCALAIASLLPALPTRAANIVQDASANYIAWEAENNVTIVNATAATWAVIPDANASGGSTLQEQGVRGTDGASSATWTLVFNAPGTYTMYIRYMLDPCCGANSYLFPTAFGGPFPAGDPRYKVSRANENGAGPTAYFIIKEREQNQTAVFAAFTVAPGDVGNPLTFSIANREAPGVRIDRIILSQDTTLDTVAGRGFKALPNSDGTLKFAPQPADVIDLSAGQNATFTASVVGGTGPYTYKWYTNGVLDVAAVASSYTVLAVAQSDSGRTFQVVATDATSLSITSRTASLTVFDPNGSLSVSFEGRGDCAPGCTTMAPGTTAGVIPLANWNNIDNSAVFGGVTGPLNNVNGGATTITLNYNANDAWNDDLAGTPTTGDQTMMKGISKANGGDGTQNTYTFQNVPVGDYDAITYLSVNGDNREGDIGSQGTTYYYTSEHIFGGTFIQCANTVRGGDNPVGPRDFGNFVKFVNLTPDPSGNIAVTFVNRVSATGGNADGIGISGFQLFKTGVRPISITSQPADTVAPSGTPFSFTVGVAGSGPYHIQWYEGTTAISGANALTYSANAALSQNGHHFHVTVSNDVPSGAVSADAVLTVASVPSLLSAGTLDSLTQICIRFSKPLDATIAADITHYAVNNGITVTSAALAASDPSVVILTTSAMTAGTTYTITVTGLKDTSGNTQFPNPASTTVTPGGYELVRLVYEQYRSLNSGNSVNVSVLTGAAKYPNNPDFVEYNGNNATAAPGPRLMEYPQTSAAWIGYGNLDDFGGRYRGLYLAPSSGNYQFAITADDHAELWLSTDANPANKVLIATMPDWSGERQYLERDPGGANDHVWANAGRPSGYDTVSANIPLFQGSTYYMEALYKEGGGGDHVEVCVRRPGDPAIANGQAGIPFDQFAPDPAFAGKEYYVAGKQLFTPGPVTITTQPSDQHVVEGSPASFSVDYTATPPTSVQWYEVSSTATNPVGTGKTLTVTAAIANNGHHFRGVVQNACSTATSRDALLTVDVDTTKPTVADAGCDPADRTIRVQFSEAVLAGGGLNAGDNPGNYTMDQGFVVNTAVLLADNKTVLLGLNNLLTPDASYSLMIANVKDRSVSGNTMDPVTVPIKGCICTNGVVLFQMYLGDSGANTFATITNNPKWPNSPDNVFYLTNTDWIQTGNPGSPIAANTENYSGFMRGYIIAPSTGNYTFYEHADDSESFAISTDSTKANLRYLIYAPGDCGGCTEKTTAAVSLVAGRAYYFEGIFQEGGGGDYLEVRWSGPSIAKGFIPTENIRYCFDPLKVPFIVTGPNNQTVTECRSATFSVNVTAPDQGAISYQWLRDGSPITGATSSSYTIQSANLDNDPAGDNGAVFTCHVAVGLRSSDTSATLTVMPDGDVPTVVGVVGDETLKHVWISFSERMEINGAQDTSQYALVGADSSTPIVTGATLVEGTNVVLTLDSAMTEGIDYTLILGDQLFDACARNSVASGTQVHFRAWVYIGCLATAQVYDLASLGAVQAVSYLTSSPLYPRHPRETYYIAGVDSRLYYPNDSHDFYGARIIGFFNPPVDGNYTFWAHNDDDMSLRLNSNPADSENPTGAGEILAKPCCNADVPYSQASAVVALTAGHKYYFEALYKEGIGGDYLQIAATREGQPAPSSAIGPDYIGTRVNPDILSTVMPTLPTSGKLPLGTLGTRGFDVRIVQVTTPFTNTLVQTEAALAGTQGPNVAGNPRFFEPNIINYSIEVSSYGSIPNDAPFPGIPGISNSTDNIAMEVLTYLELHAGIHCMIVNSDDGFRLTPACGVGDPNNSMVLGQFDGGRGATDSPFVFKVPSDGLYPFRLIWQQGGGGGNVEWVDLQPGNPQNTATPFRYAVNGNSNIRAYSPTQLGIVLNLSNGTVSWTAGTGAPCHNWKLQSTSTLDSNPANTVWTTIVGTSPVPINNNSSQKFFRLLDAP